MTIRVNQRPAAELWRGADGRLWLPLAAGVTRVLVATSTQVGPLTRLLEVADPHGPATQFWTVILVFMLPAIPFAVWKARGARSEERRRTVLFAVAIVASFASCPTMLAAEARRDRETMDYPAERRPVPSLVRSPTRGSPWLR